MHPQRKNEPEVKAATRTDAVRLDVIVLLGLVLLIGVTIGL